MNIKGEPKKPLWRRRGLRDFHLATNKAVYMASSVACFWAGAVTLLIASSAETVFSC